MTHRILIAALATCVAGPAMAMEIKSPAVGSDNLIPDKYIADSYGCSGENMSLPLEISGVPAEAKSLAITMYDPDAPTGSGIWHWEVANLPPDTTSLAEGAGAAGNGKLPEGAVQARNDAGTAAYFGPCPPRGDKPHRYVVTVYAVGADALPVDENASGAVFRLNLNRNTLDKASVTYLYGR